MTWMGTEVSAGRSLKALATLSLPPIGLGELRWWSVLIPYCLRQCLISLFQRQRLAIICPGMPAVREIWDKTKTKKKTKTKETTKTKKDCKDKERLQCCSNVQVCPVYEGYEARVGMQAMGARDQHGGGNTLRLDADDHDDDAEDDDDDHDDDADDDDDHDGDDDDGHGNDHGSYYVDYDNHN